ncbi:PAS domain-containing sensor histidine kinase [Ancylobacter lacus]|uniref:PAS domain-containing sensor histidine kinase n=1 Tax=Ancylobacter lacus TaxID=2579970 RepID=UPI001BCDF7A3|nr:PAS domain-containing sensor histidine kinase [Ancylobacter lacus]MBS7539350.1 PAS domain-containing sensor histidine kinase [Ancylobacter lacus]
MGPLIAALDTFLDGLVHPSVRGHALLAARHRGFIASRLAGGVCALAAVPMFLGVNGAPGPVELVAFAWLLAPIAIALSLSRSGNLERAHLLSALTVAGLVAAIGWVSGGLDSFVLPWLLVVPLEAALTGSRRVVAAAALMAAAVGTVLFAASTAGVPPLGEIATLDMQALRFLSFLAAVAYAAALAAGATHIAVTGERLSRLHEARYDLLAQNMSDLLTRHSPAGAVEFASPAAQALLGGAPETLVGEGLFERVHVADRPAYRTALSEAACRGTGAAEFRVRRGPPGAAGGFIWVEMRARLIDADAGGAGPGVVAVMRDVSERKRNELALAGARETAERADLAKTRFLAAMSHELRTPLNAIIGFSEVLASGEESRVPAERRAEYARLIHDSGQHLLGVVNGILDLSRIESGLADLQIESFDPRPLAEGCRSMMALKAEEKGLRLAADLAAAPAAVRLDRRALKQILLNLIANAIKFTPPGGEVALKAEAAPGELVLCVADTGIGIAEADMGRLGQPFFQARATGGQEGTGLGLSVVKGLAALLGGRVEIESRLGAGTTVRVRLPMEATLPEPKPAPSLARLPLRPAAPKSPRLSA